MQSVKSGNAPDEVHGGFPGAAVVVVVVSGATEVVVVAADVVVVVVVLGVGAGHVPVTQRFFAGSKQVGMGQEKVYWYICPWIIMQRMYWTLLSG